ncbi:nuclear transport factor 2 family protein [Streptomyces sp. TS71-3]|uniref:nuclear transport factor 2 family protein n=1 Tax=Streptomyces sp. TS71-3 TaxID=2733862 RepID=UPI001B196CC0|nr:nuclear transport factor 2 family protein [Streptomyces sp. TS71-3]GHJ39836.1 hypothetical protein Sm713_54450 [Streptomyces sp. TS71-3]
MTPTTSPTASPNGGDPAASRRAIEDVIITYARLVDTGDFAGLGSLFADADFVASGQTVTGGEAVETLFRQMVITYADGTPRTKHVTTNLLVDVDEEAGTATARSYYTVLQSLPDLPLQIIVAGRYRDRFTRHDGRWRLAERHLYFDLVGDVSHHLRAGAPVEDSDAGSAAA